MCIERLVQGLARSWEAPENAAPLPLAEGVVLGGGALVGAVRVILEHGEIEWCPGKLDPDLRGNLDCSLLEHAAAIELEIVVV